MKQTMILTGDVTVLGVTNPAVPFSRATDILHQADVVFGNLECCLYDGGANPLEGVDHYEGYWAPAALGEALKLGGFSAVGCANNATYGAEAIRSSLARLDELGILHAGAGINRKTARAPAILDIKGVRYGFLQYTSQFWPVGHEAGERSTGVATLKGHTSYEHKIHPDRPGVPPVVITWADPEALTALKEDIVALKKEVDVVVSAHHWGHGHDVLQYQVEIGHAAVDAGADIVLGHGPHWPEAIEVYKDKPIFYSLGAFFLKRGSPVPGLPFPHWKGFDPEKPVYANWLGLMVRVTLEGKEVVRVTCMPVRPNERDWTIVRSFNDEPEALELMTSISRKFGASLELVGGEAVIWQRS